MIRGKMRMERGRVGERDSLLQIEILQIPMPTYRGVE